MVRRKPFGSNHHAVMKHPRLAENMAFAAYAGLLYRDVVTYARAVTDLRAVQPAVVANLRVMTDNARQGKARVAGHRRTGKDDAVFIVDPAVAFVREGALIFNPAAFRAAHDVVKIRRGNNLS